jgi:hypothetical protein
MSKRRLIILAFTALAIGIIVALTIPSAKGKADSISCGNYIVSIGFVARAWSDDHDGRFPPNLVSMSNELGGPGILICPGDRSRQRATNWASFTPESSSYEIVSPGLTNGDTNGVFLRCKIHGHLGYTDCTVFDGTRRRTKFP